MKAIITFALAIGLSAGAAPMFRNPYPVAIPVASVSTIVSADFNGDDHPDVMLVDSGRALAVFLNDGTGPFAEAVVTPITYVTGQPGIGDVNQDGRLDVVVTDLYSRTVTVLLGAGDGSFIPGSMLVTNGNPRPAAVGDFNSDGYADIAVGVSPQQHTHELHIYHGDGTGNFGGAIVSAIGNEPRTLVVADLDQDGKSDLLVGSWPVSEITLANGDGTFRRSSRIADGDLGVGDFNRDGVPDVAVAAGGGNQGFIEVRMGRGDGSLGPATHYVAGYGATSIAVADVDSDGHLDLLAAGTMGSTVTLLRGRADGTFRAPEFFLSGPSAWKIVLGDFDRDQKIDFITLDYNSEIWSLSFVRGNGDGTFRTYRAYHTNLVRPVLWPGLKSTGGITADMNNDGHRDVVVLQKRPDAQTFDLGVLLGDGTGKLAGPILKATTRQEWAGLPKIAVGDVNGDGHQDVVTASNLGYTPSGETFLGDGNGSFGPAIPIDLPAFGSIHLADFDGDSNLDLLISGYHSVVFHRGHGDGSFAAGIVINEAQALLVGDLNGDGRTDFVSSGVAFLSDGTGHFARVPIASDPFAAAALADFNGDGRLDLLSTSYTGSVMRFGKGDGTFDAPIAFKISPAPNYPGPHGPVATADVNGDGHLDVAFGSTVYLGNGNGTFLSSARFRTNGVTSVAFAEMNEDGSPDLLLQKSDADDIVVLTTYDTEAPTERSSVSMTISTDAPRYGESVTFTAHVTGSKVRPAGGVLFSIDGTPFGIIALGNDAKASITHTFTVGAHQVVAKYVGDENYLPSTATRNLSVAKGMTTLWMSGSPNPQAVNRSVTVQVYGNIPTSEIARITLRNGDTPLSETLVNGQATLTTLEIGTHVIHADYPGSENHEPSTANYTQTITKRVPSFLVTADPSSSAVVAGTAVTLHASFLNNGPVTGTVSFYDDSTLLATVPLTESRAAFQLTPSPGHHTFWVHYSGDDMWAPIQRSYLLHVLLPWGSPVITEATGYSVGGVRITWLHVSGAASYTVWRKTSLAGAWEIAASLSEGSNSSLVSAPGATSLLVAVTAVDANGNTSPMSAPELATTITPLEASPTVVKAQHFLELRLIIASVRALAGLAEYRYTNLIQTGQTVRNVDLRELRLALSEARAVIGLPNLNFSDPVVNAGVSTIRSIHIVELRAGAN